MNSYPRRLEASSLRCSRSPEEGGERGAAQRAQEGRGACGLCPQGQGPEADERRGQAALLVTPPPLQPLLVR